jgi:hypothetical protein
MHVTKIGIELEEKTPYVIVVHVTGIRWNWKEKTSHVIIKCFSRSLGMLTP